MPLDLPILIALTLVVDVLSTDCPSTYTQTNFILKNHVLVTSKVQNYEECSGKCASHKDCYSFNFYDRNSVCELNSGSHVSHPVDLTYNSDGTYVLGNNRFVGVCSDRYCSTDEICVMKNQGNANECKACATALGMESKAIPNSAITASSEWSPGVGHQPWRARLNNYPVMPYTNKDVGCWAARYNTIGQFLQVNLGHVVYVTMVATQGRPYKTAQRVTKYSLAYKNNANVFVDYKIANVVKIFPGNTDQSTIVTHRLPEKIKTQVIRFVAREWNQHISMRAEIYGCQVP